MQVDEHDTPSIKLIIHDAEVLWNPFDDLQPRVDKEEKKAAREEAEAAAKVRLVVYALKIAASLGRNDMT